MLLNLLLFITGFGLAVIAMELRNLGLLKDLDANAVEIEGLKGRIEELGTEITDMQITLVGVSSDYVASERDLAALNDDFADLLHSAQDKEAELAAAETCLKEAETELANVKIANSGRYKIELLKPARKPRKRAKAA